MKRRKSHLADIDQDILDFIERETQDNIERGMSPEEARYAAQRKFGNSTRIKEDVRGVWSFIWFEQLLEDIRFGLRMLCKSPGFTAVAALTLALGIGANTYIFSVVDALLFRPLEFPDPPSIMALWERLPAAGIDRNELSPANFLDLQAQNHVFDHIAAEAWWDASLGGVERPEHLHGFQVTPDYFSALETPPMLGRSFQPEEGVPGKDHVAILSYALWRDHFSADPAILGKPVLLNGIPFTVVGVMGPTFNYPSGAQVWSALAFSPQQQTSRNVHYLHAVAHLAPGVTPAEAQSEMSTIAALLAQRYPETNIARDINVMPLMQSEVGQTRAPLIVLLAAVGLVLLIACANISNLLLARASSRQRETAIRVSMGATRARLICQGLVESMLLGLLGGVLGIFLAFACLKAQVIRIPPEMAMFVPGWNKVAINFPVLVFTCFVSLGTGLLFGILPALQSSKINVNNSLKENSPSAGLGRRRGGVRNILIVAEVAFSLALLAAAGLMMKSFVQLEHVSPGFNPDKVLTMSVALSEVKYSNNPQISNFYDQLLERLQSLPGVNGAGVVNVIPLGGANTTSLIRIQGQSEPKPGEDPDANYRVVSDSYFQTMQIPVLQGREFTRQDSAKSQPVVAVNAAFAARFWPGENPVGKQIRFAGPQADHPWQTVVALVGNVRTQLDLPARPEMYFPLRQQSAPAMVLVVRTAADPRNMAESIRSQVVALDRDLPVFQVMTMEDWRSVSVIVQRIGGTLMTAFAGFALLLAAMGLFGVIAYAVSERTHEIGLRMALGAGRNEIFRLVVGQGMLLALIGLLIGLPLALGVGRAVAGLLYGVSPNDLSTYATVAFLLAAVAFAACYIPARRAMRVDPMVALRNE
jgi:predicted permease